MDTTIARMQKVLQTEARALDALAQSLGPEHAKTIEILRGVQGRIVVSGVGKSGHVGRKMAATFASTGTPAQFVHPTEASHGDLGMITRQDAVIGISNSGEAAEMNNLINYTRRFGIPLIAITSKPDSTLGQQADICLTLPDMAEACLIGKAPTTSTTATMALGDALAVALMESRGFGPDDYHVFHPGGRLGAQLTKVDSLHACRRGCAACRARYSYGGCASGNDHQKSGPYCGDGRGPSGGNHHGRRFAPQYGRAAG